MKRLLGAGGIELDDGLALFDGGAGRGHPGDAEVGDHGGGDLDGALGLEFAAAADDDEEIALAGGGGGEDGGGLGLAVAVDAGGGAADDEKTNRKVAQKRRRARARDPSTGVDGGGRGWGTGAGVTAASLIVSPPLAGASTTTAAERSGMRWGSVLSSLKTAVKVLIGLPKAEEATGLANSKWAGRARSG